MPHLPTLLLSLLLLLPHASAQFQCGAGPGLSGRCVSSAPGSELCSPGFTWSHASILSKEGGVPCPEGFHCCVTAPCGRSRSHRCQSPADCQLLGGVASPDNDDCSVFGAAAVVGPTYGAGHHAQCCREEDRRTCDEIAKETNLYLLLGTVRSKCPAPERFGLRCGGVHLECHEAMRALAPLALRCGPLMHQKMMVGMQEVRLADTFLPKFTQWRMRCDEARPKGVTRVKVAAAAVTSKSESEEDVKKALAEFSSSESLAVSVGASWSLKAQKRSYKVTGTMQQGSAGVSLEGVVAYEMELLDGFVKLGWEGALKMSSKTFKSPWDMVKGFFFSLGSLLTRDIERAIEEALDEKRVVLNRGEVRTRAQEATQLLLTKTSEFIVEFNTVVANTVDAVERSLLSRSVDLVPGSIVPKNPHAWWEQSSCSSAHASIRMASSLVDSHVRSLDAMVDRFGAETARYLVEWYDAVLGPDMPKHARRVASEVHDSMQCQIDDELKAYRDFTAELHRVIGDADKFCAELGHLAPADSTRALRLMRDRLKGLVRGAGVRLMMTPWGLLKMSVLYGDLSAYVRSEIDANQERIRREQSAYRGASFTVEAAGKLVAGGALDADLAGMDRISGTVFGGASLSATFHPYNPSQEWDWSGGVAGGISLGGKTAGGVKASVTGLASTGGGSLDFKLEVPVVGEASVYLREALTQSPSPALLFADVVVNAINAWRDGKQGVAANGARAVAMDTALMTSLNFVVEEWGERVVRAAMPAHLKKFAFAASHERAFKFAVSIGLRPSFVPFVKAASVAYSNEVSLTASSDAIGSSVQGFSKKKFLGDLPDGGTGSVSAKFARETSYAIKRS